MNFIDSTTPNINPINNTIDSIILFFKYSIGFENTVKYKLYLPTKFNNTELLNPGIILPIANKNPDINRSIKLLLLFKLIVFIDNDNINDN